MNAEHVQVNRVENGWVVTVWNYGSQVILIAKTVEEVAGFIKGMDWQAPRPLPYGDAPTPAAQQATIGGSAYPR